MIADGDSDAVVVVLEDERPSVGGHQIGFQRDFVVYYHYDDYVSFDHVIKQCTSSLVHLTHPTAMLEMLKVISAYLCLVVPNALENG